MGCSECSQKQDRGVLARRVQRLDDIATIGVWQSDVHHYGVEPVTRTEQSQSFSPVVRRNGLVSSVSQATDEDHADGILVFAHPDRQHNAPLSSPRANFVGSSSHGAPTSPTLRVEPALILTG
jgi:hypothetical protein